jgi:hypothetical protein
MNRSEGLQCNLQLIGDATVMVLQADWALSGRPRGQFDQPVLSGMNLANLAGSYQVADDIT